MEAVDADALEGDLDSFTEEKEAVEFLLNDLSTAESKEEVEEDMEEGWSAGGSRVLSDAAVWSFPLEESRVSAGRDDCVVTGESGSAAGEDGGEV